MRRPVFLACAAALAASGALAAAAAPPGVGTLSVEQGRGAIVLEIRGAVLGRLAQGTLRVTDLTPRDRFEPIVTGRRLLEEELGPRTIVYRGQGLRFRMVGGGYRIVVRGAGISLSAVGRGQVVLDGEPRFPGDSVGVYSLQGVDCGEEEALCTPLPEAPERHVLGKPPESARRGQP
ncbi:MAG TPA: hypothetical protein VNJ46_09525 [Gaiellaceae bacterium]|nr:hypothetical protein [Gaiellaceae bacterium]